MPPRIVRPEGNEWDDLFKLAAYLSNDPADLEEKVSTAVMERLKA